MKKTFFNPLAAAIALSAAALCTGGVQAQGNPKCPPSKPLLTASPPVWFPAGGVAGVRHTEPCRGSILARQLSQGRAHRPRPRHR